MKRACAITGPTPYFVRWAIDRACPFREILPQRLPETTFRQLRSLREISQARAEDRIWRGVCLHPSTEAPIDQVLGFPVDEVVDLFGGQSVIEQTCGICPANASIQESGWAGCYGNLATDLRIDFQQLLQGRYRDSNEMEIESKSRSQEGTDSLRRGHEKSIILDSPPKGLAPFGIGSRFDLVATVDRWITRSEQNWRQFLQLFDEMTSPFFAFWTQSPIELDRLRFLHSLFTEVVDEILSNNHDSSGPSSSSQPPDAIESNFMLNDLHCMILAMKRSIQHQLPFYAELVPTGYSDGIHWRLSPHCGRCKSVWNSKQSACRFCGPQGRYQNQIKLKVLGLRPYLRLAEVIGQQETEDLLASYRSVAEMAANKRSKTD